VTSLPESRRYGGPTNTLYKSRAYYTSFSTLPQIQIDEASSSDYSMFEDKTPCELPNAPATPTKAPSGPVTFTHPDRVIEFPVLHPKNSSKEGLKPEKRHTPLSRKIRHTFFNVYRRLFTIVFLANTAAAAVMVYRHWDSLTGPELMGDCATAASANVLAALMIRQEYMINTILQ